MNDDKYKFSYVAICDCGVVVAATIDHPDRKKTTARHVSEWLRDGYVVERILSDQVGELFKTCQCTPKGQLPLFETDSETQT
jgi:hypothetical protein